MKIIFRCRKGHEYESKEPITTGWAQLRGLGKKNDVCKKCGADIIAEEVFDSKGNLAYGALRI